MVTTQNLVNFNQTKFSMDIVYGIPLHQIYDVMCI